MSVVADYEQLVIMANAPANGPEKVVVGPVGKGYVILTLVSVWPVCNLPEKMLQEVQCRRISKEEVPLIRIEDCSEELPLSGNSSHGLIEVMVLAVAGRKRLNGMVLRSQNSRVR